MPLLLLLVIIVLALATSVAFLARAWLPALAATHTVGFDPQLHLTLAIFGVAFLVAQFALAIFIWRFREGRGRASVHGGRAQGWFALEIAAILFTGSVFLGLGIKGGALAAAASKIPNANALQIEVTGMQFQWYYRYPGDDGKLGAVKPELADASIGNPLGLDPSDSAGEDDIIAPQLVVPVHRPVELTLKSLDVVHSFFVPSMRLQMNAVPGLTTHVNFTPEKTGVYEVVCNQLCGLGHYRMHGSILVLAPEEFEQWMQQHERK
ncbi:MAG TPA: cytochrome C oxidase subunit II [Terriglobales bacterium]